MNFGRGQVERGLDGGPLGCDHRDFIVAVEITGTDSGGVADGKGVTLPEDSAEGVSAVPVNRRFAEKGKKIGRGFLSAVLEKSFFKIVTELEQQNLTVLKSAGVMTGFYEFAEKFLRVGEVEVARQDHGMVAAGAFPHEWMTSREGAPSESSVAEMSEVEFGTEGKLERCDRGRNAVFVDGVLNLEIGRASCRERV